LTGDEDTKNQKNLSVISLSTIARADRHEPNVAVLVQRLLPELEWRGVWNIDRVLKTNFSAGKHFGETRTKSGSYI
jgi:hypothetical protein